MAGATGFGAALVRVHVFTALPTSGLPAQLGKVSALGVSRPDGSCQLNIGGLR